ncbi:S-layer homology domain-containing protein [Cohnella caldifontis]|uniref:S-layer homology domain-containing protein n=1 Tax=Cohnella caldifontis TaxID=3027471 RepID=UPI0023EB4AA5|nr:S-layer homology domain-containing protein [Cohnella sp. YIM B05605]
MKSRFNILLIAVMLFVMSVPMGFTSAAAKTLSDIQGNWAEKTIEDWVNKGFISGNPDGTFKPGAPITRAELVALINRSFGYSGKEQVRFSDVPAGQWYSEEVAKAVAAGYTTGFSDGTFKPAQSITRQELAVMVAKILKLEASDSAGKFTDTANSPAWSKGYIGAVIDKNIMQGDSGMFRPASNVSRAEAVAILDRALKQRSVVYDAAGVFGPATGTETIDRNVIIDAPGATLQNVEIHGDLTISANVGNGDLYLKNVKVNGTTVVNGGGEHSVHMVNSVIVKLVVNKKDGSVRIVVEGSTSIQEATLQTGATMEGEEGADIQRVTLSETMPAGSKVTLIGTFETVDILAAAITVGIPKGTVGHLNIAPSADQVSVNTSNDTQITSLVLNAVAKVLGQGIIQKARILADGASIESKPKQVEVGENVRAEVGGQTVTGGSGNSGAGGSSTGGGDSGGDDSGDPKPANKTSLSSAIKQAQAAYDQAVEGNDRGQYPFGAKDALKAAIQAASIVLNQSDAAQQQVDAAVTALNQQIMIFSSKKNLLSVSEVRLQQLIDQANAILGSAVEGSKPGEYEMGSIAILESTLNGIPSLPGPKGTPWPQFNLDFYTSALRDDLNVFVAGKKGESDAVITNLAGLSVSPNESFSVSASVYGTVYVVPYSKFPLNADEVRRDAATFTEVTATDSETQVSASGLKAGNYKMYLIDEEGKLSKAFIGYQVFPIVDENTVGVPNVTSQWVEGRIVNTVTWNDSLADGIDGSLYYMISRWKTDEDFSSGVEIADYIPVGTQQFIDDDPELMPGTSYTYDVMVGSMDFAVGYSSRAEVTTPTEE